MAVYDHLKNVMITTLKKDYSKKTQAKKKYTTLVDDDEKWMKVMEEIKQCAVYLKDTGHEVDVDDLNEDSEEEKRPGFLTAKPTTVNDLKKYTAKISKSTLSKCTKTS